MDGLMFAYITVSMGCTEFRRKRFPQYDMFSTEFFFFLYLKVSHHYELHSLPKIGFDRVGEALSPG